MPGQDRTTWREYGGASDSAQYSSLKQINRSNVGRLEVAWRYPTGDGRKYSFNPIVVDGVLFVLAKNNSIAAVDAATGKEMWMQLPIRRRPSSPIAESTTGRSKDRSDRRLLFAAQSHAAGDRCAQRKTDPQFRHGRPREI